MTFDAIALCRDRPSTVQVLAALQAACPQLRVLPEDRWVTLADDRGAVRLHVEGPRLVQVAGEAERLLGVDAAAPIWWVESRARGDDAEAADAALRFIRALVVAVGGVSWSSR